MSGSDALPLITKVWLISQEVEEKEGWEREKKKSLFFVPLSLINKSPPTLLSQSLHLLKHLFIVLFSFSVTSLRSLSSLLLHPPQSFTALSLYFSLSLGRPATGSVGQDLGISSIPLSTPPHDCTLFLSPTYPSPLHKSCRTQSLSYKCWWSAYSSQDRKT